MIDLLYNIQDLQCSYNDRDVVLEIRKLALMKGKIYFFIGASGVGKSTLLETLGMMNYPVIPDKGVLLYHNHEAANSIHELWKKQDSDISEFRKNNFSFIFQNTNLMPHFTAGENMCYTLLIEGKSWKEAKDRVLSLMPSLSLDTSFFDRPVQQLSGGQRQRLAFTRAFVSSFEVMFGDEPTGNLDPLTAASLMRILREYIINNHKTAIIVSHDIKLAMNFADRIYYLKKGKENGTGFLDDQQFFENKDGIWFHNSEKVTENVSEALQSFL